MRRPRIGFLLPHYGSHSRSYMPSVVRAVADAGAEVDVIHPLERAFDRSQVRVQHDVNVLRQMSPLSLRLWRPLPYQAPFMLNPYPVTASWRARPSTSQTRQSEALP